MVTGVVTCSRCGAALTPAARFCATCGTPLPAERVAADVRKTVTALFCDVTGSTELAGNLDAEALRGVMERYFARTSAAVAAHGGTVEKFVGDAVMAVFGVPVAHEDDALRACRAAVDILAAVTEVNSAVEAMHGEQFAVRIGIETGEVLVGDPARGSSFATGPSVNMAARLEQAAGAGECLIGPACHRLVRDGVDLERRPGLALKGVAGTVDAWLLAGVRDEAVGALLTPLVGRVRELALLQQAYSRAAVDGTCQLATVLGVAGMGKSRLTAEFLSGLSEALVLHGRCVSYGEGVTYWPLVEAVRQAAGLTGSEPEHASRGRLLELLAGAPDAVEVMERVAPLAGLGGVPGPPEDSAWALRKLLEALAAQRPVVLAVEDLHWAEPGLVRLLEDVCMWLRDVPVLLLVNARPEFLDDHASWGAGQVNGVTALLEPFGGEEMETLAANAVGGALPNEALDRVRELSGGNPLYVEHVLAMLVEDGVLQRDASGWRQATGGQTLSVPPTVTALIAARLDRLTLAERAVLGPASVMGQIFYRAAVAELAPSADVSAPLQALARKGLLRSTPTDVPGQDALCFAHALIREAAYGALPKAIRADLHERFARWLDKTMQGQAYDDFVGGHLEAAYHNLVDLGGVDERSCDLGREAAERLSRAAEAVKYADDEKAVGLLERAHALGQDEGPDAWSLRMDLARAMLRSHRPRGEATALAETVREAAAETGDLRWTTHAKLLLAMIRQQTEPEGATGALRAEAESALALFESFGDDYGLSLAHDALSSVAMMTLHTSAMNRELILAAEHAEAAGMSVDARVFRQNRLFCLVVDDTPAERAREECRRVLADADDRRSRASVAAHVAFFSTLLGRDQEGEAWLLADELAAEQQSVVSNEVEMMRAWALCAVGAWAEASTYQARVCRHFEAAGAMSYLSTEAAASSLVLLHLGEIAAARQRLATALRLGSSDDLITLALAGATQAWLAAIDGDLTAASAHMDTALGQLTRDQLLDRALVHVACAEISGVLGDVSAARAHRRSAIDLYRAKGNVVGAAHHEALLAASAG